MRPRARPMAALGALLAAPAHTWGGGPQLLATERKEASSAASSGTVSTSMMKLMIDVKDASKKSGSILHGPAPAQRSRGRLSTIWEVFEVRFESLIPFQVCLGSKGELCVDRTGGRDGCSTRTTAHPPLLVCAWRAYGEPHGRRQGESFPPVGTRGEVRNGVSGEPRAALRGKAKG